MRMHGNEYEGKAATHIAWRRDIKRESKNTVYSQVNIFRNPTCSGIERFADSQPQSCGRESLPYGVVESSAWRGKPEWSTVIAAEPIWNCYTLWRQSVWYSEFFERVVSLTTLHYANLWRYFVLLSSFPKECVGFCGLQVITMAQCVYLLT